MNSWQTYRADEIDLSEGLSRNKGEDYKNYYFTECGSVWLERVIWDHEAAGSNPVIRIKYP